MKSSDGLLQVDSPSRPHDNVGMDGVAIEQLTVPAQVGVTEEERSAPQPLEVTADLAYGTGGLEAVAYSDDLQEAIDYLTVAEVITEVAASRPFHLLETLAQDLAQRLAERFQFTELTLLVRKRTVAPPMGLSFGVRLHGPREAYLVEGRPAGLLIQQLYRLAGRRVLDVAAGRGRHALYLAARGFEVDAVDRDEAAMRELHAVAKARRLPIHTYCLDLEEARQPVKLPADNYDVVVVFFYLYRPMLPLLIEALRPGGLLLYETFLLENYLRYGHPRHPEFCLHPNELLRALPGTRVLFYEECEQQNGHSGRPAFTARLVAMKEPASPLERHRN